MPLLNRKAFQTDQPPSDLKENEELFVCRQTNEVYRDYESFFKRTILCNSLVWSCEVTLKPNLTYEEAAESEKEAKKIVQRVPEPIQRGVLTLVHYTRHSRLDNLCDEVFNYIRERYQEGEEVDVKYKGEKLVGYVHNVIEPKILTNGFDSPKSKNKLNSPSGKPSKAQSPSKTADVIVLSDGESEKSEVKSPSNLKKSSEWPDAKRYQYMIKLKRTRNTPSKNTEIITVKQSNVSRKKGVFSRDKLKLMLRLACYRTARANEPGYWKVKDEYRRQFDLSGDVDDANESIIIAEKTSKKRKKEQEKNEKKNAKKLKKTDGKDKKNAAGSVQAKTDEKAKFVKPKLTLEEIEKLKEEMRLKREKEKELRKQERDKARQERSELLKEQKMFLLHWCVPQDDLDLDDHKELPKPVPMESKFSPHMFGDVIMVLEFLYIFGEFFGIKQDFPDGITLEILEDALTEHDAEGSFYDIIRFLLSAILQTHAEEEEEEGLDDIHEENVKDTRQQPEEDSDMTRVAKAVSASAAMAAAWAQVHQGRNLHELTLDPFTCSEILRLLFLSSGASLGADGDFYRWQRRGGFTFSDDAGVAFRHHEHGIMRALVTSNVYDLNAVEKLKILMTLCAQLLTYATTRDIIDDGFDRLRKAKREWQEEQWADQRKDKEEAAAKYRKRMEEKAKEREEKNKLTVEGKTDQTAKDDESTKQEAKPTPNENDEDEQKAFTRSRGPVAKESTEGEDSEERERQERKNNLKKSEKAYLKEMKKTQSMSGVQPIGSDRLFRRYWVFNSLNGLFIEDNDPNLPKLLQSQDNNIEISNDDSNSDSASVSTEEDLPVPSTSSAIPHHTPSVTSLSKQQIEREKDLSRILQLYNIPVESLPENCVLNSGELGLKREQISAQLTAREVVQWSYLDKKEDFDQLLKSLNPRGHREKYLRESLLESYDVIVKGLRENPLLQENRQHEEETKQTTVSSRNQTVDKSLYKTMEDFIEASLRDQILDLEDRIWQAGLGMVKVEDIVAWRKQVENGIYDFLHATSDNNTAEGHENGKEGHEVAMELDQELPSANHVEENASAENMEVDQPPTEIKDTVNDANFKLKLLSSVEDSRPRTPVDGSFIATPTLSRTPQAINPCVRILAKALLQVEQGIERKYLIPPFGDDDETKKRKQQEAVDAAKRELNEVMAAGKKKKEKGAKIEANESDKLQNGKTEEKPKAKQQKTLIERWEESLMSCTNLAQVSIHLTNLDNCISWDKSVLNARCRICRRKGDAEHMLLCDGCDKGHHMYCLKPPIKQIPEGDWFCSQCRPVEPRRSIRRRKTEESDEEAEEERQDMKLLEMDGQQDESENETEEEASDNDSDDDDDDNDDDEDEEESDDDDDTEEDGSEQSSDDESSVHMESCACCDGGGELLCCETCPLAYHLECAYPQLRRIPRGSWACQVCTGADHDLPTGRRVKKAVIKAAQNQEKSKETSKPAAKKGKTESKPSKQQPAKIKTDPPKAQKKSDSAKRAPPVRTTPAVRVSAQKSRSSTPRASAPPGGLSNSAPSKPVRWPVALTRKCEKLLKEIMGHEDSWPFLVPVDKLQVPDYATVIKTPMDLQTIKTKLSSHKYNSTDDFAADVRQIFFNCSEYNKPRTREARAGIRLSAHFETRYGELGLDSSEQRGPRTRRSR